MRVDSELSLATILGKSKRICCYRTCPITNAVLDDNSARRAPPLIQYLVFNTPPHLALPCTQTLRSSEYIGDEGIIVKVSKMQLKHASDDLPLAGLYFYLHSARLVSGQVLQVSDTNLSKLPT